MRNFFFFLFTALLITLTTGCTSDTMYETPGGGNTDIIADNTGDDDDSGDTGTNDDDQTANDAWNAFGQTGTGAYVIHWDLAETSAVESFPSNGWSYVDGESVIEVSPYDGEVHEVTLIDSGGTSHQLFLYTEMPEYEKQQLGFSDDCDNCKVTTLQPDDTVVEVNYYGSHNWILPGNVEEQPSVWTNDPYAVWGADAGAHVLTRTGMLGPKMRQIYARIQSGEELTEEDYNLGHNIHVALDTSILGCFNGASSQDDCHTELVNDADSNAHEKYNGDLPMGYPVGMPDSFDCMSLNSHYGRMICATAKHHPILPTEASNESDMPEIQFMLSNGLAAIIYEVEGEYPFNNDGNIAADMDTMFQPDGSALVAIDNYDVALEVPQ